MWTGSLYTFILFLRLPDQKDISLKLKIPKTYKYFTEM